MLRNRHLLIERKKMGKKVKEKLKFYSGKEISKFDALYNIIIGERSNGKTFYHLDMILDNYLEKGEQGALIRRWDTDFKSGRGQQMFSGVLDTGKLVDTEWSGIDYKTGAFYLYKWDSDIQKKIYDTNPFCFAFSLTNMEHDKSTSYPNVTTIVFDEFMTRKSTLPDEFILFTNVISTIVRHRDNVKIYMLANTVNKFSPYFKEMGLTNVKNMNPGTIDLYRYGDSGLTVAVEYCDNINASGKPSDKYFAFNNPKLQMITGGAWELAIYPHKPCKFENKDINFIFFIKWEEEILQCEVVFLNDNSFIFIHRKTTPIKDENEELIFSPEPDFRSNWRRRISHPTDRIGTLIWRYFQEDKVYYQDNEVGEVVRSYLQFCRQFNIVKD